AVWTVPVKPTRAQRVQPNSPTVSNGVQDPRRQRAGPDSVDTGLAAQLRLKAETPLLAQATTASSSLVKPASKRAVQRR
ncbi:MAG: hypothetical protein LC808_02820, partial [Actinobacteria bacterium]|nr:hypothetical protein [Actinomycetota bacterium]